MLLCDTERIIKDEDVITEHFTVSQVICSCAGFLLSAVFTCGPPIPFRGYLYDGIDSSGKLLLVPRTVTFSVPAFIFDKPIRFNKGLYLTLESGLVVTIQYIPDY